MILSSAPVLTMEKRRKQAIAIILAVFMTVLCVCAVVRQARVVLLALSPLVLLYALLFLALSRTKVFYDFRSIPKPALIAIGVMCLVLVALIFMYSNLNEYIYFWDNGAYWYSSLAFIESLESGCFSAIREVFDSINDAEYNLILSWIMSAPLMLFSGYSAFVAWGAALFLVPSIVLFARLATSVFCEFSPKAYIVTLLLCLSFSPLYVPILFGYADIAVVLVCVVLLNMAKDIDFTRNDLSSSVYVGILLLLLVLLRRYFAYWAIGYVVLLIFVGLGGVVSRKGAIRKHGLTAFLKNALLACVVGILPLCTVFNGFLVRSLFGGYSDSYAGYVVYNSLLDRLCGYTFSVGPCFILFASLAFVVMFVLRARRAYLYNIGIVLSLIVTLAAFWRVQDFTVQHYYVIDLQIGLLCYSLVPLIVCSLASLKCKIVSLVLYGSALFLTCFHMLGVTPLMGAESILGKVWYQPMVRNDLEAIHEIDNDLEQMQRPEDSLYVVASSTVLNDDVIRRSYAPDKLLPPFNVLQSSHVDLRDGFPVCFFEARYVLVADPVQLHMPQPGSQSVTEYLTWELLDPSSNISSHYRLAGEYVLDDDVKAYLFERVLPYSLEDVGLVAAYFEKLYPDQDSLFRDRFDDYEIVQ